MKLIDKKTLLKEKSDLESENKRIDRSINVLKSREKSNNERIKSIDELTDNQYEIDFKQSQC